MPPYTFLVNVAVNLVFAGVKGLGMRGSLLPHVNTSGKVIRCLIY
jgi:hypothetical protein